MSYCNWEGLNSLIIDLLPKSWRRGAKCQNSLYCVKITCFQHSFKLNPWKEMNCRSKQSWMSLHFIVSRPSTSLPAWYQLFSIFFPLQRCFERTDMWHDFLCNFFNRWLTDILMHQHNQNDTNHGKIFSLILDWSLDWCLNKFADYVL